MEDFCNAVDEVTGAECSLESNHLRYHLDESDDGIIIRWYTEGVLTTSILHDEDDWSNISAWWDQITPDINLGIE